MTSAMKMGCLALAAASSACDSSTPTGPDGTSAAEVDSYRALAAQTQAATASYRATMMGSGATLATCATIHDGYDNQVRPWISTMVETSSSMDGLMDAHHGATFADMACVAGAMLHELDAHRATACRSPDLDADRAEAARHADAIAGYTGHELRRCDEMLGGLDGQGWSWGSMMGGCHSSVPSDGGMPPDGGSDPLAIGRRIFDQGIGVDGQPIPRTSQMGMSGGCASCHGIDGHGRRMMMFTSPNITYVNLTDPAGMLDPDGTRGSTYSDAQIRRAVVDGLDPDGDALATWMPRWQLRDEEWTGLLAFLESLP